MKYDVFISYSSKDQKVVEGICGFLESNGVRCFVAYRDIPKSKVWATAIVEALEDSGMMLIAFTDSFNHSSQVEREMELASEAKKPILTFRLTNSDFIGAKKYYLKNLNWIDAFPNPERSFGELYEDIASLLCLTKREKLTAPKKTLQKPRRKRKIVVLISAAVMVIILAIGALLWYNETMVITPEKAHKLYRQGVEYYGNQEYEKAYDCFIKSAKVDNDSSQFMLGVMCLLGQGIEVDNAKALEWFSVSAASDNADAMTYAGILYYTGEGGTKNDELAYSMISEAANQNQPTAQTYMGLFYENGGCVTRSLTEAKKWYKHAADQGETDAQERLDELNRQTKAKKRRSKQSNPQYCSPENAIGLALLGGLLDMI